MEHMGFYRIQKMSSIDKKIRERIKKAAGNFEEAVEVFETVLPILEKNLQSDPYAIRLFEEGLKYLKEKQSENEAMVGQMKEVAPSLTQAKYDWAHLDMLERAKQYFVEGDVDTIVDLLNGFTVNPKVLEDAFVRLSETNYNFIKNAMEQAQQRKDALQ